MSLGASGDGSRLSRPGRYAEAALLLVGLLFALTWFVLTHSGTLVASHDSRLQAAFALGTSLTALGASYLAVSTYLASGHRDTFYVGAGFAVLGVASALVGLAALPSSSLYSQRALEDAWGLAGVLAASLWLAASTSDEQDDRRMRRQLVGTAAGATVGSVVLGVLWVDGATPGDWAGGAGSLLELIGCVLFFAAAALEWRRSSRQSRSYAGGFAYVLCIAGFVALQYALHPVRADQLTVTDILRVALFTGVLLSLGRAIERAARETVFREREIETLRALGDVRTDLDVSSVAAHVSRIMGPALEADVRLSIEHGERDGADGRLERGIPEERPETRPHAKDAGYRAILLDDAESGLVSIGVQLGTRERRLGLLVATRPAGRGFSSRDVQLFRDCAAYAELLLERSSLREEVAAAAVVEERSRLAREIHDGLAQHLAFLKMRVAWLRRSPTPLETGQLEEVEGVLEAALAEARQAITTLRSETLGTTTADAIAAYASDFGHVSGLTIEVAHDTALPEVGPKAHVELLRIVQEALNNVRKHAHASRVDLAVRRRGKGVEVTVRDDGVGFADGSRSSGHYGIEIMRERAESIGGHFDLESAADRGTTVRVWVPALERTGDSGHLGLVHG